MKTITEQTILKAIYPDGKGNHELSIDEFRERFKEEDSMWLKLQLINLREMGFTNTRFCRYEVK